MADLFVSYSREDKARAAEIVHLLEDHGWDVFWDQETRAGMLWPKVLEEELIKARCLVALWTTTSIGSRWVRIEAYEALQNEKLVPVLLDKVRPPLEFRQTQTFDLIGWKGDRNDPRLSQLLVDLTALAKAPGSHGPVQRPVQVVVPATLRREVPDTTLTDTGNEQHGASQVPQDSVPTVARSRRLLMGFGVAAAVVAIVWWITAVDPSPTPAASAQLPAAPSIDVVTPTPTPPQPIPDDPAPAKKTEVAASPAPAPQIAKPLPKPPQRSRSARCLAIEEKFQQTGQITATERDFLRGKECQS